MFYQIIRIAKYHKPKILLLENVKNLTSIDGGAAIETIKCEIEGLGYSLRIYNLNASHFGIPQARQRLYFVAIRKDAGLNHKPIIPTNERIALHDILLPKEMCEHLIIKRDDIIWRDFNEGKQGNIPIQCGRINTKSQRHRIYNTKGHAVTQSASYGGGGGNTGLYLVPDDTREGNKIIIMGTLSHGKRQAGRILSEEGHAVTQTANKHARTASGLYTVNGVIRRLHITECKRVMGFPDSHIASDGNRGYSQLGNAVIPKMIEIVLASVGRV